jgi:hypothetical protein
MKLKSLNITFGLAALAAVSAFTAPAFAAEEKDETVTMQQVPADVQKAIAKYATESEVKKIEKGDVDGKMAYEFEIEKAGKKSEVTLLPNGELLATEEAIALADVPATARKTIEEQATGGKILSTEKVFEKGKTAYEAVIEKGGKKTEITVDPKGKLVGTEEVKEASAKGADEANESKKAAKEKD